MIEIKKIIKVWKNNRNGVIFLLSFALFVYSLSLFWSGFHSFDSAQNLIFLRDDISIDLLRHNINYTMRDYVETTTKGYSLTLEETYVNGVREILLSVPGMLISLFGMGYYFCRLEGD